MELKVPPLVVLLFSGALARGLAAAAPSLNVPLPDPARVLVAALCLGVGLLCGALGLRWL